jgi:hypothetical protein
VETIHLDGSGPFAHTIADFNGDGFPDLAIANSGTYPDYQANVAVLLGDGLGGLEGATGLGAGGADMALVATDLNGDGHADLVVANGGTGEVRSFLGDGTGRLMPAGAIQQGFLGLVAADFNGDGVPDLAATIYFADSVNVLLGDGHGGFTPAADLEVGKSPRELAVGDFDRDGRADLAVASSRSSAVNIMFSQLEQRADTNGSNRIDGFDIAAIARLAGVQRGDVAYRRNADVDLNGVIDGDDLALCAHRMGKLNRGASPLRPRLQQAIPPVSNTVTLQPLASDGDLLTVSVMVSDADDLVAGADFAVAFDPTPSDGGNGQVLEYVGFTPGTFLSGGAGQAYSVESTTPGRVDVAVSRLPNEDRPGGPPRPLMNLLFRARRTGQADLTFGPRQQSGPSLLNAAGQDVPGVRFVSESIVQVDASGGGAPGQKIAYAPDVLDFGDPALGTAVKKVLRLSNFGFSELRVTSVASTLPEFSTYFTCDSAGQETSCPSVPPYGFVELPVVFSTARAGVLAATLVIDSDDPQQPEIYVPLVGRSSLPVSVTPQHLDFGRVTNGQATTAKVRITNRGGNPLVLTGYESSDAAFIAQPEFSTLATGEAGDIEVTFQPTSATEHRAVITLGFDAPAEKVAMVSVVGIGDAVRTMASRSSARSRAPLEAPSPTPPR